jgi:uncharacterized membrane protein
LQTGIPVVKVAAFFTFLGSPLAAISPSDRLKLSRIALALALVCLVGVGFSATIIHVHGQIDQLGDKYTSFCNVNDSINCDRVLSSPYAKLAGVPVAWMALAAWLGLAGIFAAVSRSEGEAQARLLRFGAIGIVGALVFSAYMAVISVFRLETICLLCTGLYGVALTSAALLVPALRFARGPGGEPVFPASHAAATFVTGAAALTVLALTTWPEPTGPLSDDIRTAQDVQRADPEFYAWYTSLPKVDPASLVRDDQKALTQNGKVAIVDFFDLECAHCKKNYLLQKQLQSERADEVAIIHRHFPLDSTCNDIVPVSIHPNACRAAEAVECAGLQGKHDEMLDLMFRYQGQLFAENLPRLAGKIALDKEAFQRCLDEHTTLPLVLADARAGARLEIKSTPTIFVGGRRLTGTLDEIGKYEMAVLVEASASH